MMMIGLPSIGFSCPYLSEYYGGDFSIRRHT